MLDFLIIRVWDLIRFYMFSMFVGWFEVSGSVDYWADLLCICCCYVSYMHAYVTRSNFLQWTSLHVTIMLLVSTNGSITFVVVLFMITIRLVRFMLTRGYAYLNKMPAVDRWSNVVAGISVLLLSLLVLITSNS